MTDFMTMKYNVDMVFCIDATGSMSPVLETVKQNALNFYDDVTKVMNEKQKSIDRLRIRVIAFRDYLADGDRAMFATNFFDLPAQAREFETCIKSISAKGGGDERRNVIVVWTDASTHEIGFGKTASNYPKGMPQSFAELTSWWGDEQTETFISNSGKRLVLFAPQKPYWEQITNTWNNVIHYPSTAGKGLEEYTYREIVDAICNSF